MVTLIGIKSTKHVCSVSKLWINVILSEIEQTFVELCPLLYCYTRLERFENLKQFFFSTLTLSLYLWVA